MGEQSPQPYWAWAAGYQTWPTPDLNAAGKEKAWVWWVLDVVLSTPGARGRREYNRSVTVLPPEGVPASTIPRDDPRRRYTANKESPPLVWRESIVRTLVPWTPEVGQAGAKDVAGMKYLNGLAEYRATHSKIPKGLEFLAYGEEAIRNNPKISTAT